MEHKEQFEAAVRLAEAFIQNGDIRLWGSTAINSNNMVMLEDTIASLYKVIGNAEASVLDESQT